MRALALFAVIIISLSALGFAQSVFHPAEEVKAGIFGSAVGGGNYTFNNSMFVVDKLGIGTASPANKFEVYGDGVRSASRSATSTGESEIEAQAYNYWGGTGGPTYTGTALVQYSGSATGTTAGISNAGLGILRFQNNAGTALIYTNGADLAFGTTSVERMRILSGAMSA